MSSCPFFTSCAFSSNDQICKHVQLLSLPGMEIEGDQREAEGDVGGEISGEQADEPEEVMVLDLEEESTDG